MKRREEEAGFASLPPLSLLFALRSPGIQAECVFQLPGLSAFTPKLLLQSFEILNHCRMQRLLLLLHSLQLGGSAKHAVPVVVRHRAPCHSSKEMPASLPDLQCRWRLSDSAAAVSTTVLLSKGVGDKDATLTVPSLLHLLLFVFFITLLLICVCARARVWRSANLGSVSSPLRQESNSDLWALQQASLLTH